MAFDPVREDYQRLDLRFKAELATMDPLARARSRTGFHSAYMGRRDSLPQTDADRAFALVVQATDLVDYQLPFVPDHDVEPGIARATEMLDEALALDEHCHDARRMKAGLEYLSFEQYYRFLADGLSDVRAHCEAMRDAVPSSSPDPRLERHLAVRPYLRWANTLAGRALISGRYRIAASLCAELMAYDEYDLADARFTQAIALAKLEDEAGLVELERELRARFPESLHNAWLVFGKAALAFRQRKMSDCRSALNDLQEHYPHAAQALIAQNEYPDSLFCRMAFDSYSENELLIALSEATVLWQEGLEETVMGFMKVDPAEYDEMHHTGTFGTWLENDPQIKAAAASDVRSPYELIVNKVQRHEPPDPSAGGRRS